eukprot:2283572-Ditylum_brightwellii.AAC.1
MGDEDVALAIVAHEAAFCTNVVASYVFEMMEVMFMQTQYRGIYRDNRIAGGGFLQFTTKIWEPMAFQSRLNMLHKEETRDAPDAK